MDVMNKMHNIAFNRFAAVSLFKQYLFGFVRRKVCLKPVRPVKVDQNTFFIYPKWNGSKAFTGKAVVKVAELFLYVRYKLPV